MSSIFLLISKKKCDIINTSKLSGGKSNEEHIYSRHSF